MKVKQYFIIIILFLLTGYIYADGNSHKSSLSVMNTVINLTIVDDDAEKAEKVTGLIDDEFKRIEKLLNFYDENSGLSQINKYAWEKPVVINDELFFIIEKCIAYSKLTDGMFDITVGPLVRVWREHRLKNDLPSDNELIQAMSLVDYRNIMLDNSNSSIRFRKKGMQIDLGGVAKGYAADKAMEILKKYNIKNAIIGAGGDLRIIGKRQENTSWKIGVRHPRKKDELITVIELNDNSISTSGDYERYYMYDGVRYHHLLNPKTGQPARGCISATIIGKSSFETDILDTSVFVLGPEKGMKLIESLPGIEGIIITEGKDGLKAVTSKGLAGKLEFKY